MRFTCGSEFIREEAGKVSTSSVGGCNLHLNHFRTLEQRVGHACHHAARDNCHRVHWAFVTVREFRRLRCSFRDEFAPTGGMRFTCGSEFIREEAGKVSTSCVGWRNLHLSHFRTLEQRVGHACHHAARDNCHRVHWAFVTVREFRRQRCSFRE